MGSIQVLYTFFFPFTLNRWTELPFIEYMNYLNGGFRLSCQFNLLAKDEKLTWTTKQHDKSTFFMLQGGWFREIIKNVDNEPPFNSSNKARSQRYPSYL